MNGLFIIFIILVAALLIWIRVAPSDQARWHVDPALAAAGRPGGVSVRPEGGDLAGPMLEMSAEQLMTQLQDIALATPRTKLLFGSVDEGRMTFVTRSRLIGFPDYATVAVAQGPAGAVSPIIDSRLRFGRSDLGVNRARIEQWMSQLR